MRTEASPAAFGRTGAFGAWTRVVPNDGRLLFLNAETGAADVSELMPDGDVKTVPTFPPSAFGRWTHVVG